MGAGGEAWGPWRPTRRGLRVWRGSSAVLEAPFRGWLGLGRRSSGSKHRTHTLFYLSTSPVYTESMSSSQMYM